MKYSSQSLDNINNLLTLSGFNPIEIEACESSLFSGYFEVWQNEAFDYLESQLIDEEILKLLKKMDSFGSIGEFLFSETEQRNEIAAFLLILLDRFAKNASENFDVWNGFRIIHEIYECFEYAYLKPAYSTRIAKRAADQRHKENRELKEQAKDWYLRKGIQLTNDKAAIYISEKLVPIKLRTAQNWVGEFRRNLPPASKG